MRARTYALVVVLLNSLCSANAETCSVSQERFNDAGDVATYIERLNHKIEGELGACESLVGIYQETAPGKPKRSLRISKFQPNELILMKGLKSYGAAFKVERLNQDGSTEFDGVAIRDKDRWKISRVVNPKVLSVHSVYPEGRAFGAFEKYKATGQVPDGAEIESFDFTPDRTVGRGEYTKLTFEDEMTIKSQVADASAARTVGLLSPNEETRIHHGMYSLLESKDFRQARESGDNSKMIDMLWTRSLELMKGDKTAALYLALLTTDLRTRGPCGSFYARRGRDLVPRTIFNGERPTALKENRLDALQHFFGYALLQTTQGQRVAEVVSKISKDKDYYGPRLTNFTKEFHVLRSREFTKDGGGFNILTTPYFERERTGNDIEVDKFYNKLGIEFGRRLDNDVNTKPSAVIDDANYNAERQKLGLGIVGARSWYAFDPALEVPSVNRKPPEQRKSEFASLDYSKVSSCNSDPLGSDCEVGIKAAAAVCANGVTATESGRGCRTYNDSMKSFLSALKRNQTGGQDR